MRLYIALSYRRYRLCMCQVMHLNNLSGKSLSRRLCYKIHRSHTNPLHSLICICQSHKLHTTNRKMWQCQATHSTQQHILYMLWQLCSQHTLHLCCKAYNTDFQAQSRTLQDN
jgi:hypothetical protein